MSNTKREVERTPSRTNANENRPQRVSMSSGGKFSAPQREGYQRYWAITGPDHPGKLDEMKAAWWEFVLDEESNQITRPAGKGNAHILMEIPQQYYDEDMRIQQDRNIDATQQATQTLGADEYLPKGRVSVVQKERYIV